MGIARGVAEPARCRRCVLPEGTPGISFDANSICNYCGSHEPFAHKGEHALAELLDRHRDRPGSRYDCLVGISGGRDSAFALLSMVKDHGLRVLAVNYENPFTVGQAKKNIESTRKTLGMDLVRFPDRGDFQKRTLQKVFASWLKRPNPALVPLLCIGCKSTWLPIYRIAREHRINCIVAGVNSYETSALKRQILHLKPSSDSRKDFFKYIVAAKEIVRNPGYFSPLCVKALARGYLFGNPAAPGLRAIGRGIETIALFDYIKWDHRVLIPRITDELGWAPAPNVRSSWRFDCRVKHLADYLFLREFGVTDKDDFYAKMVREGLIGRDEALAKLADETVIQVDEIRILLEQLGVSDRNFVEALERDAAAFN